jgi:hypothetical protein
MSESQRVLVLWSPSLRLLFVVPKYFELNRIIETSSGLGLAGSLAGFLKVKVRSSIYRGTLVTGLLDFEWNYNNFSVTRSNFCLSVPN